MLGLMRGLLLALMLAVGSLHPGCQLLVAAQLLRRALEPALARLTLALSLGPQMQVRAMALLCLLGSLQLGAVQAPSCLAAWRTLGLD